MVYDLEMRKKECRMPNIKFVLMIFVFVATGWPQAWQTVRSFRGTGVPAANMCNTGADLGITYTDRNPNGLTYVCRLNGAGAFTWYVDTPAGGSQPLNANLTTLSATGNVPTATALLVNPAACVANNWVMDIAADGTLTCTQPASTNLSDSGAIVRGGAALLNVGYPMVVSAAGQAGQTPILGSAVGGTGNGFTKFTGPTTAEKTFTLPDASATVLTTNAPVTVLQGGTGATTLAGAGIVTGAAALTEVDTIPRISAAGVLGLSKLKCPLGICNLTVTDAATNTVSYPWRLTHISSGAVAAGFGAGSEVELETATDGTNHLASIIETTWETATAGAEDSIWNLFTVVGSAVTPAAQVTKSQTYWGSNAGLSNTGANPSMFGVNAGQSNTGAYPSMFGVSAGYQNNWDNVTLLGAKSATTFAADATTAQAFTDTEITANTITFGGAHGFAVGKRNLLFTTTAGMPPTGLVTGTVYQFTVVNATVVTLVSIATDASLDFAGTLTNSTDVHNSIAVGYDAVPTKAHQAVLGAADITETVLRGNIVGSPGGTVLACKTVTVVSTNVAFQAAATTATVALETLPAKAILTGVDIKHSVIFSDGAGAMTEVGVTVGSPTGGATFFSANQNIGEATAVADTTLLSTSLFKRATAASEALNAYFTATGRNFGDGSAGTTFLATGSVDIGYCYFVKP